MKILEWNTHRGPHVETRNGFDIIDCETCGFKHAIPVPTEEELETVYSHDYYTIEKPLYIERYTQDLEWWNMVYGQRYELFERLVTTPTKKILDIGSGPGYFLLNGKQRGWTVKGIEPSEQAASHSQSELGIDVDNCFFSEETSANYGQFTVINMGEVLEHLPDPMGMLSLAHRHLEEHGLLCLIVPNDFNPFQEVLQRHNGFEPWWVAPPHHLNYFSFESLSGLVERAGFEVVHTESTFPIDMFLLMGEDYIGNDPVGRQCHTLRMNLEKNLISAGKGALLSSLYQALGGLNLGREILLIARKK